MSLLKSKILLVFCNFLLLGCGCILVIGGLLLLLDLDRILLSKLLTVSATLDTQLSASFDNSTKLDANNADPTSFGGFSSKPPLYFGAIGCACLGILLVCIGTLGCWSSCLRNHCALTSYFLLVTTLLVGECAIFLIAWLWPHCLGLAMDSKLLSVTLQRRYGTPGQEQFTAAIDLAQVSFRCCGIKADTEYATSAWKMRAFGPGLSVPLTCCRLPGEDIEVSYGLPLNGLSWDKKASRHQQRQQYLDPTPINITLCQEAQTDRQNGYRHVQGCGENLELWFQNQYMIFLASGLVLVLVEFAALLSTVLACAQIFKKVSSNTNRSRKSSVHQIGLDTRSNTFERGKASSRLGVPENLYNERQRTGTMSTSSRRHSQMTQGIYQGGGSYVPGIAVDDGGSFRGGAKA